MSAISRDGRAIVEAVNRVSTQVGRLVDALAAGTDAPTTTADDGARYRLAQARNAAALHRQGLISDSELNAVIGADAEAPAADEDAQRTTRRNSLLNLLDRLDLTRTLTPEERTLLRRHVEAETREHDTARSVARSNLRHVKTLVPELENADRIRAEVQRDRDQHAAALRDILSTFALARAENGAVLGYTGPTVDPEQFERWRSVVAPTVERPWWETVAEVRAELEQAQAAIERVRALADRWDRDAPPPGNRPLTELRAALDGTEQPTTEA
jgi:hypothetical protein